MRDHVVVPAELGQMVVSLRRVGAVAGFLFGLGLLALVTAGQASADDQSSDGGPESGSSGLSGLTGLVTDVAEPAKPVTESVESTVRSLGGSAEPVVRPLDGSVAEPVARSFGESVGPVMVRQLDGSVAEPVARSLVGSVAPAVESVEPTVRSLSGSVAPVVEAVRPLVDAIAPVVAPVVDVVGPVVRPLAEVVGPVVRPVLEPVAPVLAPVLDSVAPVAEPLVGPVLRAAEPVLSSVTEAVGAEDAVSGLVGRPAAPPVLADPPRPVVAPSSWSAPAAGDAEIIAPADTGTAVARSADPGRSGDRPGSPLGSNAVTGGTATGQSGGQHGADGTTPTPGALSGVDGPGDRAPPGVDVALSWLAFENRDHPS